MKHLTLFLLSSLFTVFFFLISTNNVYAGCIVPDICDAVGPGACSDTCNGGKPCTINNGWVNTCKWTCVCDSPPFASCSIKGGQCGQSGTVYTVGGDYGICGGADGSLCVEDCTTSETQCFETIKKPCCNLGAPLPSATPIVSEYCGNGTCNAGAGETQYTCESDCGSPPAGAVCGDNSCNGGENCSTCSGDCGSCPPSDSCGNGICGTTESCSSCPGDCGSCLTCGNGTCNASESCSSCASDCGVCPDSCGDNLCTGFEDCGSCPGDCGSCFTTGDQAWWQTTNGHVFAGSTTGTSIQSLIFSTYCLTPNCIAQLITPDSTAAVESEGVAISGGGVINTNGFTNSTDTQATGSKASRFLENYTFFYRNSTLGLSPANDFVGQESDILKPSTIKEAYFHRGNVTLQTPWVVAPGESYTIFIDGNLTITDPTNANQLTDVDEGGFLAFIVSGDITISETVGNEVLTDTTSNLEGIFIADGLLTLESRGEAVGGDDRFIGEGSFISWTRVALDRDFSDGVGREVENQDKPVESFIFRPDFIRNTPEFLTRPHTIWQESN